MARRQPQAVVQPAPQFDFRQIIQDAQSRWLRPQEICEVLRNFVQLNLKTSPAPPYQPRTGSLFVFDRKALRYFRKDGHNWRKKKDGKTVKEAHERLKVGSVNALHCYYAHGEENPNFQRRSYWLLEGENEHLVLVHYLEAVQGSRSSVFRLHDHSLEGQLNMLHARQSIQVDGSPEFAHTSASPPSLEADFENYGDEELDDTDLSQNSYSLWDQVSVSDQGQGSSSKSKSDPGSSIQSPNQGVGSSSMSPATPQIFYSRSQADASVNPNTPQNLQNSGGFMQAEGYSISAQQHSQVDEQGFDFQNWDDIIPEDMGWADVLKQCTEPDTCNQFLLNEAAEVQTPVNEAAQPGDRAEAIGSFKQDPNTGHLHTLESFGSWMLRELDTGTPASDSAFLSTSTTYDEKAECDSARSQGEPILSVQMSDQKFTILDFSPDWAYSFEETKVLVSGEFHVNRQEYQWSCMFGEVEVLAEVFSSGVLRCKAPSHAPGVVPFYITCNDRSACSQIKEFQFRERSEPSRTSYNDEVAEELLLRTRFVRLLHIDDSLSPKSIPSDAVFYRIRSYFKQTYEEWDDIKSLIIAGASSLHVKDRIFEVFSKFKLQDWLIRRVEDDKMGACMRDSEGQGIIHLACAIGFDWAVAPILAAGVNANFRDTRGWTALHWAAYFGRERTILALLAGKAIPELLSDPTASHPNGQTAANIASARGHGGIAGFLAEASLQHHLSVLTLKDSSLNEIHYTNASLAGERAVEVISEGFNLPMTVNDLSMKQALVAVRHATQAAGLIQAAFRQFSFRKKQEIEEAELLAQKLDAEYVQQVLAAQKIQRVYRGHKNKKLNAAATKIQSKFRGYKGRQEFLNTRRRVIKIQAHFRGYQARKQYRKILWSVGVLEKVVLRWHRGRHGLRGFHAEERMVQDGDEERDDEFLREGRKQKEQVLESAVECVQAMVHSPEARAQYLRMLSDSRLNPPRDTSDVDPHEFL